jgi:signal transduction histidine kinase
LSNTIKYAHATEVDITLQEEENSNFVFTYADNGNGLDADYFESMKTRAGLGIRNIESRVKMIKGTCVWENEPGKGLKFIVTTSRN